MARKFAVIEADGSKGPMLKKCAALLLVRRQVAVMVAPFLIRRLSLAEQPRELSKHVRSRPRRIECYEHHIEPRINQFDWTNNEWQAYLHGYRSTIPSGLLSE